ncbi:unnamed protein product [Citrullus colocynthis]|uniref:Uncharacterized protein n=1 Tax=Citrullus colocynthis TaxID=252529 RepID=A0ABP0XQQ7_9ROSI
MNPAAQSAQNLQNRNPKIICPNPKSSPTPKSFLHASTATSAATSAATFTASIPPAVISTALNTHLGTCSSTEPGPAPRLQVHRDSTAPTPHLRGSEIK